MQSMFKQMTRVLGIVLFAAVMVPMASAGCADPFQGKGSTHLSPQSWNGEVDSGRASLLRVSDRDNDDPMVGMWHVSFVAKGNIGPGLPPDGVLVDNALSQWHSDGTEITSSSRNPTTGSICLGVWKRVGFRHYRLNHFGISWDPSTDPNNPQGFANIRQDLYLGFDGRAFRGTFSIEQFDQAGNLLVGIKGQLIGTRVDLNTSVGDLL